MRILYQICCFVMIFMLNVNLSLQQKYLLPLPKSNSSHIFVRIINSSTLYIGNLNTDIIYDIFTCSSIYSLSIISKCAQGTMCPLLLKTSSGEPKYLISKLDLGSSSTTASYINDLRNLNDVSQQELIAFGTGVIGVNELDENKALIFTTTDSNNRGCIRIEINDNGIANPTTLKVDQTTIWNAIKLDSNKILHFSFYYKFYYHISSWNWSDISSYSWHKIEQKHTSINEYFQIVKVSNVVILCYLTQNKDSLNCFSYTYDSSSSEISALSNNTEIISDCYINTDLDSFSLYVLDDQTLVVGCGDNPFKIRKFSSSLEPKENVRKIYNADAIMIDYIPLSDSIFFIVASISTTDKYQYYGERIAIRTCETSNISQKYFSLTEINLSNILKSPFDNSNDIPFYIQFTNILHQDKISLYSKESNTKHNININQLVSTDNIFLYSEIAIILELTYIKKQYLFDLEIPDFSSETCTTQITICSISCEDCVSPFSSENHNCISCKSGYFPTELQQGETAISCYNEEIKPSNYFFNPSSQTYQQCYSSCLSCLGVGSDDNHNCVEGSCVDNYFPGIPNQCHESSFTKEGYTFYMGQFTKCQPQCRTCEFPDLGDGEHYCIECNEGYIANKFKSGFCEKCMGANEKYYYDSMGNFICVSVCPDNYPLLISSDSQCVYSCLDLHTCAYCKSKFDAGITLYEYNNECVTECPYGIESGSKCKQILEQGTSAVVSDTKITYAISSDTSSDNLNEVMDQVMELGFSSLDSNPEHLTKIEGDDFSMDFYTTSTNATALKGSGSPRIELGECERILRSTYQIPEEEHLVISQIVYDNATASSATNQMQYEVYTQDKRKLSLEPCKDVHIKITKPLTNIESLNLELSQTLSEQGIDIYNSESPVFNDRCTTLSIDGKDVSMQDRRGQIYTNVSFCESGCSPKEIDYEYSEVQCECNAITEGFDSAVEDFEMLSEFTDFISNSNFALFMCVKLYANYGEELKTNIGNFIALVFAIIVTVLGIFFLKCQITLIYSMLNKYLANPVRTNKYKTQFDNNKGSSINIGENIDIPTSSKEKKSVKRVSFIPRTNNISTFRTINSNNNLQSSKSFDLTEKDENINEKQFSKTKDKINSLYGTSSISSENQKIENDFISKKELNDLEYNDAEKQDTRSFCKFFWDIFCEKQIILSTITAESSIFTPLSFRITMLLFSLSSFLFLNALLFTEDFITNRYNTTESLGIVYMLKNEISKSMYSSILGMVICKIVNMSTSSAEDIGKLLKNKNEPYFEGDLRYEISSMKLKYNILIILMIIVCWIYWYFIYIFCSVYKSNQISWLESTLFSIVLNIVIPAVVCFIAAILRISALKCHISLIYNLSNCLYGLI